MVCREKGSEKLYSLSDPNWNVVALCDDEGIVKERFNYDAFGRINGLTSDWDRTFTGQVLDHETGLMLYRNRFYHAGLGRFVTRDPVDYLGGDNLYNAYFVPNQQDPHGLMVGPSDGPYGCCAGKSFSTKYSGCCNDEIYSKSTECCENGMIAAKVSVWIGKRPIRERKGRLYPLIAHSYLCCDGCNLGKCYNMTAGVCKGDPVPEEVLAIGNCEERKVCPSIKKQYCDNPIAPWDYRQCGGNCNTWTNSCR